MSCSSPNTWVHPNKVLIESFVHQEYRLHQMLENSTLKRDKINIKLVSDYEYIY
jgi:hypothetical protein